MENSIDCKQSFSFRIIGLDDSKISVMMNTFKDVRIGKLKNSLASTFVIPITNEQDAKKIKDKFYEFNIGNMEYGIWVSLVSELDEDGLKVPDYISELHRNIGGKLDFSFTIV